MATKKILMVATIAILGGFLVQGGVQRHNVDFPGVPDDG